MFREIFTCLLVVATQAAPQNGTFNGSGSSDQTLIASCQAQMDGKLPYYTPEDFNFSGNIRRYYVSAEMVTWNYGQSQLPPYRPLVLTSIKHQLDGTIGLDFQ
jgi:hypothetical protein